MMKKRLILKKETISSLNNLKLGKVKGGAQPTTNCLTYEGDSCGFVSYLNTVCFGAPCGAWICETEYKPSPG